MPKEPSEKKLRSVAALHCPRGWTVVERGNATTNPEPRPNNHRWQTIGYCNFETKTILTLPIITRYGLYVFLHECGHARLQCRRDDEIADWEAELEAERYAIAAMRGAGIPVPKAVLQETREYISSCCMSSPEAPEPEALDFAGWPRLTGRRNRRNPGSTKRKSRSYG